MRKVEHRKKTTGCRVPETDSRVAASGRLVLAQLLRQRHDSRPIPVELRTQEGARTFQDGALVVSPEEDGIVRARTEGKHQAGFREVQPAQDRRVIMEFAFSLTGSRIPYANAAA